MQAINTFLDRYGNIGNPPAFRDLAPEYMAQCAPMPLKTTRMQTVYLSGDHPSSLGEQIKYHTGAAWNNLWNNSDKNTYSAHNVKKYIERQSVIKGEELLSFANDQLERQAIIERYHLIFEIVKLYRNVFSDLCETVHNVILPELPIIRAFLHAQGVWESISNSRLPSSSAPVSIKRFERSAAYGRHFIFVKNTVDIYSLLLSFYQNASLAEMIAKVPEATRHTSELDLSHRPVFTMEQEQAYAAQKKLQTDACARHKAKLKEDSAKTVLFTNVLKSNALPKGVNRL